MVTHADVVAAAQRIAGAVIRTPAARSKTLSDITGADVVVKLENLQFTASYKERGALNRLACLPPSVRGVVAASAGNFAQGVAYHAGRLGLEAVIVMPEMTPMTKIARTAVLGAEVVLCGETFEEANKIAAEVAADRGYELLSPFDDADVIAGQGTVAIELLEDVPQLDTLVVPVGGGGLLAGMAVAARAISPHIELVGVQTERYPAVYNRLCGETLPIGGSTIAEGIAVARPGALSCELIARLADRVEVVPEGRIEEAVALYLEVEKTVAEGAGAAPLAELLTRPERYAGRSVGLVLSGGNIDLRQLASVILRSLVRTGRMSTLQIEVDDRPGILGKLTSAVGQLGGNIVEVTHKRLNTSLHARATDVELTVETSDERHLGELIDGLTAAGFPVRRRD